MTGKYPALDTNATYTFEPTGIDKEEELWKGNGYFPSPGDDVKVKLHREGTNAALIMRPDGMPAGSCLHASLKPKA